MKTSFLLLHLAVLLAVSSAPAATLFSNLGGAPASIEVGTGLTATNQMVASEFITGSSASVLTGVEIEVLNDDFFADHTYSVRLFSDAGAAPGTLVATFSPALINSNFITAGNGQSIAFSHSGISLAADTRYWLALSVLEDVTATTETGFHRRVSDTTDPVTGYSNSSPPGMYFSNDAGSSWSAAGVNNAQFQLEGMLVPEPGRAILLLAGLGFTVVGRRRL